ncbi:MAG: leucine-rich repeat domain-containing protein [Lachnospiraceae bacterium]|nr:leucine-rich repeat domain-containing protein [Lachnospiraceae bacterium]
MRKGIVKRIKAMSLCAVMVVSMIVGLPVNAEEFESYKSIFLFDHFKMYELNASLNQMEEQIYNNESLDQETKQQKLQEINQEYDKKREAEEHCNLYDNGNSYSGAWNGFSYDASSNTITMNNVSRKTMGLSISNMGSLKLVVNGTNYLENIRLSGTTLSIEGAGTLEINPPLTGSYWTGDSWDAPTQLTNHYATSQAVDFEQVASNSSALHIGKNVTVKINSGDLNQNDSADIYGSEYTGVGLFGGKADNKLDTSKLLTYDGDVSAVPTWKEHTSHQDPTTQYVSDDTNYIMHTFPASSLYKKVDSEEEDNYYVISLRYSSAYSYNIDYVSWKELRYAKLLKAEDGTWYESKEDSDRYLKIINSNDDESNISDDEFAAYTVEKIKLLEEDKDSPVDRGGNVSAALRCATDTSQAYAYKKTDDSATYVRVYYWSGDQYNPYVNPSSPKAPEEKWGRSSRWGYYAQDSYFAIGKKHTSGDVDWLEITEIIPINRGDYDIQGDDQYDSQTDEYITKYYTFVDNPDATLNDFSTYTKEVTIPEGSDVFEVQADYHTKYDEAVTKWLASNGYIKESITITYPYYYMYTLTNSTLTFSPKKGGQTTEAPTTTEAPATTEAPTTTEAPKTEQVATGTSTTDEKTGATYTVTESTDGKVEVEYTASATSKDKKVTIPSTVEVNGVTATVTSIADNAFSGNKTITTVTIPATVEDIGDNAFKNCTKLKTVTLPASVEEVGKNAFSGCSSLTTVTVKGSSLTKVDQGAFKNCKKLKTVTLPKSVTTIGKEAFSGDKKLKTITIKSTKIKSVGKNAFKGVPKSTTIKVPKKQKKAYTKLLKKAGFKGKIK